MDSRLRGNDEGLVQSVNLQMPSFRGVDDEKFSQAA